VSTVRLAALPERPGGLAKDGRNGLADGKPVAKLQEPAGGNIRVQKTINSTASLSEVTALFYKFLL
jgi:hypothetical protein